MTDYPTSPYHVAATTASQASSEFKDRRIQNVFVDPACQEGAERLLTGKAPTRFGRMSGTEIRRRLLHILPGFLPMVLWWVWHHDPLSWDCRAWLGLVISGIGIATAVKYHRIARRGESSNPACILGYTVPVFLLLLVIPAHAEIGLATLAIIAMGDGFATVGGLLLPGPKLPWNAEKSWAGFLCFLTFAAPWSAVIYWGEARPAVSFERALLIGASASLVAAMCESLRSRINDNIRVGVSAGLAVTAAHYATAWWM